MNVMDSAIIVVLISMNETMIGVMKSNDKTLYRIKQLGEDKLLLLNMTSYKIYLLYQITTGMSIKKCNAFLGVCFILSKFNQFLKGGFLNSLSA